MFLENSRTNIFFEKNHPKENLKHILNSKKYNYSSFTIG